MYAGRIGDCLATYHAEGIRRVAGRGRHWQRDDEWHAFRVGGDQIAGGRFATAAGEEGGVRADVRRFRE